MMALAAVAMTAAASLTVVTSGADTAAIGTAHAGTLRRSDYSGSDSNMDVDSDSNLSVADSRTGRDDEQPLDEWGPDLMGDQKDRKWLASLNEVERERILAERQEKRDLLEEQRELKMKLKAGNRGLDDTSRSRSTRSDRYESSRWRIFGSKASP
ncbi:hypothetical protein DL89DRAFT_183893 [Linderina pennispora]|uniref:Clathrin light chain n=1 Tax=Linderina pennispora TaxID=61395 RepID=A0A1Y1W5G6_9FUNG|nr:uncharacterized protein DL89DRAFT_183893 [Linderina pennispora]ORX68781.1 hypothetical protein DL89DRAFT_183893 [Linderina pennispora]